MKYKELVQESFVGEYLLKDFIDKLEKIYQIHPLAKIRIDDADYGYDGYKEFCDDMIKIFVPLSTDERTKIELKIKKLQEQNVDIDDKILWYRKEKDKLGKELDVLME